MTREVDRTQSWPGRGAEDAPPPRFSVRILSRMWDTPATMEETVVPEGRRSFRVHQKSCLERGLDVGKTITEAGE